jgi:hypothetical protein
LQILRPQDHLEEQLPEEDHPAVVHPEEDPQAEDHLEEQLPEEDHPAVALLEEGPQAEVHLVEDSQVADHLEEQPQAGHLVADHLEEQLPEENPQAELQEAVPQAAHQPQAVRVLSRAKCSQRWNASRHS